jgi:hypothetical protein
VSCTKHRAIPREVAEVASAASSFMCAGVEDAPLIADLFSHVTPIAVPLAARLLPAARLTITVTTFSGLLAGRSPLAEISASRAIGVLGPPDFLPWRSSRKCPGINKQSCPAEGRYSLSARPSDLHVIGVLINVSVQRFDRGIRGR